MPKLQNIEKTIFRLTMIVLLVGVITPALFASLCIADDDTDTIILKDMNAEPLLGNDAIELKLEIDNLANRYVKTTPQITISKNNEVIINEALGQYILLPERANTITVRYTKSFFEEGTYTIESKLKYEKKESNTLMKSLTISSGGQISMENTKEIIKPSFDPVKEIGRDEKTSYMTLLIILSIIIIFSFFRGNRYQRIHPNEVKELLREVIRDSERDDIAEDSNIAPHKEKNTAKNEENYNKKEDTNNTGNNENNQKLITELGKDVMQAINEEKKRLEEEINDLERLHKKGILDADIFEKNKKAIDDKLDQISIETLVNSKRCTGELKNDITVKLKSREEKIINSINMLDKLYSDNIIDEESYEKNKNELKNALNQLKNIKNIN